MKSSAICKLGGAGLSQARISSKLSGGIAEFRAIYASYSVQLYCGGENRRFLFRKTKKPAAIRLIKNRSINARRSDE